MAVQTISYGTSPFTQTRVYTILCDTVSDLPSGTYDGVTLSQGWTAKIIENGATYLSNSSGSWLLQPSQQSQIILPDVYSEDEVDALLTPIRTNVTNLQTQQGKDTAALINLINTGSKNLMPTPDGQSVPPTRWINIPVVLQPGTYRVFFGDLQSDDTDDTRCQAAFLAGSTQVSNWLTFDRGTNVFSGVCTITAETAILRLYPSTSYASSAGDTVTFTNCMICKESDWQISQTYVPYCPTLPELYALIKSYHP